MKKNITKDDLDVVFEKYPPNLWIKLAFKYFSKTTDKENMAPRKIISGSLLIFFFSGLLGTIFGASRLFIGTVTFIYVGILALLVLFLFIAGKMNDRRISKIINELGISREEYYKLIKIHYNELF